MDEARAGVGGRGARHLRGKSTDRNYRVTIGLRTIRHHRRSLTLRSYSEGAMRKVRFTEEQMVVIIREADREMG
jgi:hypothetical protein